MAQTDIAMTDASAPDVCMYNYVVTAHKSDAVFRSVVGNFTASDARNLIIARYTRIEIYKVAEDGLQGVVDVPIYGRVAALELFRPPSATTDLLLFITEQYQLVVLQYENGELITRAIGDMADPVARPALEGIKTVIDPNCRLIGLHMYEGLFKVVPILDSDTMLGEAFNISLPVIHVLDLQILHTPTTTRPLLALLSQDTNSQRFLETFELLLREKDQLEGPWESWRLDGGAHTLVPVPQPLGGVVVLGTSSLTYVGGAGNGGEGTSGGRATPHVCTTPMNHTKISAYEEIAADRYLLGDFTGKLQLLHLKHDQGLVQGLELQPLGTITIPSSLSYLGNYVCFVGSNKGDNQLVRLLKHPASEERPWDLVEVIDTYPNLAAIVDMCAVDMERQGQCQLITCSGVNQEGSLRVVRSGIGVVEQASVELPGIKGVWSLKAQETDTHDTYLVLSFVGETRVLAINAAEELDEEAIEGFDADAETLLCRNVAHNQLLQVTPTTMRLVSCATNTLAAQWAPPGGATISVVAANGIQVLTVVGGSHLVLLSVGQGVLEEVRSVQLGFEVSCLDIHPLQQQDDTGMPTPVTLAALGSWDMRVCVLSLPDLSVVAEQTAAKEVIPRSMLLANCDGCCYLLCGMGDGALITHRIDPQTGQLSERKSVSLGTKPINLSFFTAAGARHIFAASDRPTVLYSNKGKLLYANLNENEVHVLASFNSEAFPDSLALIKQGVLTIGGIDAVQKLHIDKIPLGEMPRRIAHQPESKTLLVVISTLPVASSVDALRLIDSQTYDTIERLDLAPDYKGFSITSMTFENDSVPYYVVGSVQALQEDKEPSGGRIQVFCVEEGRLRLVAEKDTKAAVWSVQAFQGKLLACVGTRVQIYNWSGTDASDSPVLSLECGATGQVTAMYCDTKGDYVVVGDLMKSVQLFLYKPETHTLESRANEWDARWMTALTALDEECYLGAENSYNLFVVRKNSDAATDEERNNLTAVGEYHLGDMVNRFVRGSLVMRLPDSDVASIPTMLFGTATGSIGMVASLNKEDFDFFKKLESVLCTVIHGVGGLSHETWRMLKTDMGKRPCRNFVDGDLIEQCLELSHESMDKVAQEMHVGVDEIVKRVEDMARLH